MRERYAEIAGEPARLAKAEATAGELAARTRTSEGYIRE